MDINELLNPPEGGNPPDPQNPPQENTPPEGAYSQEDEMRELAKSEAELELAESQHASLADSLDGEFAKEMSTLLTPEEMELRFDEDPRKFFDLVSAKKREFIEAKLKENEAGLEAKRSAVEDQRSNKAGNDAFSSFLADNPKADKEAILSFHNEDMSPRQKNEMKEIENPVERIKFIYDLMNKDAQPAKKEEEFPPDFEGTNHASSDNPLEGGDDREYLKSIGLR